VLLPSGEKRHLLCSAVPLHRGAGEYAGTVVTLHDITATRTLEREKDEFLANISHDLRTPLGAIRMSIGAILANMPAALDQRLQRLLFTIDGASERMAKLVDDLLELSRLQAGRVHLQLSECDLRDLVSQISHTFDPLIEARHQHLELRLPDTPVWVRIDRERIERAVMNLLSNAQKYGRDGGYIRVTLSTEDDQALLAVADNGSGIAPSELARIFDRFYRAGDAALNQGSGLGLPIAKGMAELHGGSLHVSSELGQGSTFTLVLPREIHQETSRSAGSGVG
jgi:signal transduction histidine kinase